MKLSLSLVDVKTALETSIEFECPHDGTIDDLLTEFGPYAPSAARIFPPSGVGTSQSVGTVRRLGGSRLGVGAQIPENSECYAGHRLTVIGGPDAGAAFPLFGGTVTVGRSANCDIALSDASVSRDAFNLIDVGGTWTLKNTASANVLTVDGSVVAQGQSIAIDSSTVIATGQTEMAMVAAPVAPAHIDPPSPGGAELVTRSFRDALALEPIEVTWPKKPRKEDRTRLPVLSLLLPLVVGIGLAVFMKQPRLLAIGIVSPLALAANAMSERRAEKKDQIEGNAAYRDRAAVATAKAREGCIHEGVWRRNNWPDTAAVLEICSVPSTRLWERRPSEDQFLQLRVGTMTASPESVKLKGAEGALPSLHVPHAPRILDLRKLGAIGVCGEEERVRRVVADLVMQMAALHGPDELKLWLVTRDGASQLSWVRWLPHFTEGDWLYRIGNSQSSRRSRLRELAELVEARTQAAAGQTSVAVGAIHVVVAEDFNDDINDPAVAKILRSGPAIGVYAVCCDAISSRLPQDCHAKIEVGTAMSGSSLAVGSVTVRGETASTSTNLALLEAGRAERAARRLAQLRPAAAMDSVRSGMPDSCRLLDVLSLRDANPETVAARWKLDGRTTRITIGETADGPFTVDLVNPNPHAIVAGTTGAGKSQLLMTLVCALAFANSPEDLNFVLVDFKGGGAFEACADLPHTTAMVTNLEGGGALRAIEALQAEVERREGVFAEFGGELKNYEKARRRGDRPELIKEPRLIVVVDEFAALAQDFPDLMDKFIKTAVKGRSLGMNMVLATQTPTGVIRGQIATNAKMRMALRLGDSGASMDMIDSAAAARISPKYPGRAYITDGDALVEVQTAAVGIPIPAESTNAKPVVWVRDWAEIGVPPPRPKVEASEGSGLTDLDLAVGLIRGAQKIAGYRIPPAPFLPELPLVLSLDGQPPGSGPSAGTLRDFGDAIADGLTAVAIGIADEPRRQRQPVVHYDPTRGAVLVAGSQGSGRSTFVRMLTAQLAHCNDPDAVQVHVIDCGGQLGGLADLPNVGVVCSHRMPQVLRQLIDYLEATMEERLSAMGAAAVGTVAELRATGLVCPYLVVALDGWDEIYEGRFDDEDTFEAIRGLIKRGPSVGISFVITTDVKAAGVLRDEIQTKYVLRLNDPAAFADFGFRTKDIPANIPPGRARDASSGDELQFAILGSDPSPAAQNSCVQAEVEHLVQSRAAQRFSSPFSVRELPREISLHDFDTEWPDLDSPGLLVGVGGTAGGPVALTGIDDVVRALVCGSAGSGRSNCLVMMGTPVQRRGAALAVVATRRSPVPTALHSAKFIDSSRLADNADVLRELLTRGGTVLIDDFEELGNDLGTTNLLNELWALDVGQLVVSARTETFANGFSPTISALKRRRCGVLLGAGARDAKVFDVDTLPASLRSGGVRGRAVAFQDGAPTAVQTVLCS